jgi:Na+-driven multidrug efflux pump
MIKLVMASTMLIVAVSRGAKIPGYLADLNLRPALEPQMAHLLSQISFWALVTALASAALIISVAMFRGMTQARVEAKLEEITTHG